MTAFTVALHKTRRTRFLVIKPSNSRNNNQQRRSENGIADLYASTPELFWSTLRTANGSRTLSWTVFQSVKWVLRRSKTIKGSLLMRLMKRSL